MKVLPFFAISVPVRGQAEYLPDALRSLAAQTAPLRVAALDATPGDSAAAVFDSFAGLIAWRYHRPDGGQAAAIAEGWRNLDGDILGWLNADDYLYPDALARVGAVFAAHPEIDVVYGHAAHVDAAGAFIGYFPSISADPGDLRRSCVIVQPSCFVRRAAVERAGGLDTSLHYAMDWDLWCRLLDGGARFHFLDEPLSVVRVHPGTKTSRSPWRRYAEMHRIARRYNSAAGCTWILAQALWTGLQQRRSALLPLLRLGRLFWTPPASAALTVDGLRVADNRVDAACRIRLPVYADKPPRGIRFWTDRPGRYTVMSPGGQREATATESRVLWLHGKRTEGHGHAAAAEPAAANLLDVTLTGDAGGWRLLALEIAG